MTCPWAKLPLDIAYHDTEWGVPVRDDRRLFEFIILEGCQAGLSWSTILAKRENYRRAYAGFDIARVAAFGARERERLLADPGIVRNRLKIDAAPRNASAALRLIDAHGSLAAFLWSFVDNVPILNAPRSIKDVPTRSPQSDAMSKALKKAGMSFVGTTICYAFMQATGMVNDHLVTCPRRAEIAKSAMPGPQR